MCLSVPSPPMEKVIISWSAAVSIRNAQARRPLLDEAETQPVPRRESHQPEVKDAAAAGPSACAHGSKF